MPHQSGSPGGPADLSAPGGASAQSARDFPASFGSWCAARVRLMRAGSLTRGGAGPPWGGVGRLAGGLGRAQPWPMAMPSWLVMVRQMVVWGLRIAVAARVRHRSGSRGPRPCPSPGLSARPRSVASGMMRSCRTGRGPAWPRDGDGGCAEPGPVLSLPGGRLSRPSLPPGSSGSLSGSPSSSSSGESSSGALSSSGAQLPSHSWQGQSSPPGRGAPSSVSGAASA